MDRDFSVMLIWAHDVYIAKEYGFKKLFHQIYIWLLGYENILKAKEVRRNRMKLTSESDDSHDCSLSSGACQD